jgi:hypothetical protein
VKSMDEIKVVDNTDDEATWEEFAQLLVSTLIEQAHDAQADEKKDPTEFHAGVRLAYYYVLDSLANRAEWYEIPLDELGLDRQMIDGLLSGPG